MKAPHVPAAFINALAEEGTKDEAIEFLQQTWNELMALQDAVRNLYFAGYWHADREVNEIGLWTAVRDAANIKPGQTGERLGPDRTRPEVGEWKKVERTAGNVKYINAAPGRPVWFMDGDGEVWHYQLPLLPQRGSK